jgi:methylated-DNA-[protein]-cysteine S-methyltransferase
MIMEYLHKIESPVGMLTVASDGQNISGLWLEGQKYFEATLGSDVMKQQLPVFEAVEKWLEVYFSGTEPDFTPPLKPRGTPFQQSVWDILRTIPYGHTTSYGAIAKQLDARNKGARTSARAVGGAVGHNHISILIPCHRVTGSDGSMTGYAGGIDKKIQLLKLEGITLL